LDFLCLSGRLRREPSIGERLGCDGGAKDWREEVGLVPAFVEAKLELVQVALEMLGADYVIGAPQPGLEVSEDRVSPRQTVLFVPPVTALQREMVDSNFLNAL